MGKILPPLVSIIIPCKNEKKHLTTTLQAIRSSRLGDLPEVIVVDDGSTDGCCANLEQRDLQVQLLSTPGVGVAYARNLGAKKAAGELLLFCDANIIPEADWLEKLLEAFTDPNIKVQAPYISDLANPGSGGYGLTLNNRLEVMWLGKVAELTAVPLLPSTCLAIYKKDYFAVGGFDEGFRILGHEDVELSIRLWLCGYQLYINPFTRVKHVFREQKPYYFGMDHWVYNVLRMACLHFKPARIAKALDVFKGYAGFSTVTAQLLLSDVWQVREHLAGLKKYDDDWFCQKFNIPF